MKAIGVEGAIRILAGTMVLASLILAFTWSQWWFLLTAFVGINLIQSAFTGFCPAETIFKMCGLKSGGCGN